MQEDFYLLKAATCCQETIAFTIQVFFDGV